MCLHTDIIILGSQLNGSKYSNTNYYIYHKFFVCTHLNGFKYY